MLEDGAGVDEDHDREPDQRPDRPEVAPAGSGPDPHEKQEEDGGDANVSRERLTSAGKARDLRVGQDEHDAGMDRKHQPEREQRPDRPEVAVRRQPPDENYQQTDYGGHSRRVS